MEKNNILMVIAIVAVSIALLNTIVTFNKVSEIKQLTGFATDTGTANLTVESLANINFTTDTITWGSGMVDTGETEAFLDTRSNTVEQGNWTADTGLVLENIGNQNVSLHIATGKDATTFLGGTTPSYQILVRNSETDSCLNVTDGGFTLDYFLDVNTTSPGTLFCNDFSYNDSRDVVIIDINLTVPYDTATGLLTDTITATATAI